LFTGQQIDAAEALAIGLVDKVVPDDNVETESWRLCHEIASQSPAAVRALKEAMRVSESSPPENTPAKIAAIRAELDAGEDYEEGLAAFAEHREPRWSLAPED
jgi:enoyl-CoA hydratase/carnithine racemase